MNQCEKMIEDASMVYQMRGQGFLQKIDPPSRVARIGGALRTLYSAGGLPDFIGHFGGTAVAIEAKYSTSRRSVYFDDHIVKKNQIRWLEKWAQSGGIGGLLVFWNYRVGKKDPAEFLREAWFMPITTETTEVTRWAHGGPAFSLHMDWFRENAISVPEKDGGLAWGRAVEAMVR